MRLRYLLLIVLPWLAILLQSTIWHAWSIYGVVPDLLLVLVGSHALMTGVTKGTVYGLLCGLLEDLYWGRFLGINVLAKGAAAFVIGKLQVIVFKDNIFTGLLGIMIASCVNAAMLFLLTGINIPVMLGSSMFIRQLIGQAIYNTLVGIPAYIWFYRTSKLVDKGMEA